jgi:hypothetical protein
MNKVLDNAAPEGVGAPTNQILTMEMLDAGIRAYQSWNPDELEAPGMVAEVFVAMLKASPRLRHFL